ncbi:MAG: hypothetical protein VKS61_00010 [Candidatus Sericytochromatia bacterium]|nr:hypothetical protein [Candidatus Sericytochromatia bacterium]
MFRALVATLVAAFLAACSVSLQVPVATPAGGYQLQGLDGSTRESLDALDGWVTTIDSNVAGSSRTGFKSLRPMPRRTPGFAY